MQVTRRQLQVLAARGAITIFRKTPLSTEHTVAMHTGPTVLDEDNAFKAKVVTVRTMFAGELEAQDAADAGFKSIEEIAGDVLALLGLGWKTGFAHKTLVAEAGARTIHKVTFHRLGETPRLLAGFGRSGYTSSPAMAMPGEPEAVGVFELRGYSDHAEQGRVAEKARLQAELDAMTLNQRLERAFNEAKAAGLDTTFQEHSILKRIQSLESRVRRTAAA